MVKMSFDCFCDKPWEVYFCKDVQLVIGEVSVGQRCAVATKELVSGLYLKTGWSANSMQLFFFLVFLVFLFFVCRFGILVQAMSERKPPQQNYQCKIPWMTFMVTVLFEDLKEIRSFPRENPTETTIHKEISQILCFE